MSARSRRRHRRTSRKRNPFLLALVVCVAVAALGVMSFGLWVISVAAEAPAIDELQPGRAGRELGRLCRRRLPARLHPVRRGADPGHPRQDPRGPPERHRRDRGRALLRPQRRRPRGRRPRRGREPRRRRGQAGRLDDHDAARPQPLHRRPRARPRAKDQGGEDRRGARGRPLEGVDPRELPELRLLRHRPRPHRGRGRGGLADLLQQAGERARPGPVGDPRRAPPGSLPVQPAAEPALGARPPQRGPRRDGQAGLRLRRRRRIWPSPSRSASIRGSATARSASPTSSTTSSSS